MVTGFSVTLLLLRDLLFQLIIQGGKLKLKFTLLHKNLFNVVMLNAYP